MSQFYSANDHFILVPAIMLALFGCAILLLDTWIIPNPKQRKYLLLVFVIPGEFLTGFALWRQQMFLTSSGAIDMTGFQRSEEHTFELQSRSVISYAVFCLDRKSVV